MTCCGCLPALNSLVYLVTLGSGTPISLTGRIVTPLVRANPRSAMGINRAVGAAFSAPVLFVGILALVVLIVGIVVLVQARGDSSTTAAK